MAASKLNLKDFLKPNYGDGAGEVGVAPVSDSEGNTVAYGSSARLVKENVRPNVGSGANTNTGDPLRTAFIKIGNFMEAVYLADADKAERITGLEKDYTGDKEFRFLGPIDPDDLRNDASYTPPSASTYLDSDTFNALLVGDTVLLTQTIDPLSRADFVARYDRSGSRSRIDVNSVDIKNGEYSINAPALLRIDSDGRFDVVSEFKTKNFKIDFDGALARLQSGTQSSKLTAAQQQAYYNDLNTITNNIGSFRLDADNVEDAFAEIMARLVRVGYDAGYYG